MSGIIPARGMNHSRKAYEEVAKSAHTPEVARLMAKDTLFLMDANAALLAFTKKSAAWLKRRIAKCEADAKRYRAGGVGFSLADACDYDARNYRVQLLEAKAAIAKAEGHSND